MLDTLADCERLHERSLGERKFVVGKERLAPNLGGICFAPGVLTVRMRREVEAARAA